MNPAEAKLAINGGTPVRARLLPYGRQTVTDEDIAAMAEVLRSDWLTTGPLVNQFERAFAEYVGAREAVAVNSGTAALHAAIFALGIGPGEEVIVPAMTFAASANCVVFQGATPVFADVEPDTLLIDPSSAGRKITKRTRAIVAVDYAGQPCDYNRLTGLCGKHGIKLIADACHALGAEYKGRKVGGLADLSTFSFHPVKHITTGEGGMITTNDSDFAARMRRFRNHNIATDFRQREETGSWFYEVVDLGYNYRLTDFQCALGISQLSKVGGWVERRCEIARRYDQAFADVPQVEPLGVMPDVKHAYHLYVVKLDLEGLSADRGFVFNALRAEGIGVNVHYIPVHLHPYYRRRFNTGPGLCPNAEAAYEQILSLPMFPAMSGRDLEDVIETVNKVIHAVAK